MNATPVDPAGAAELLRGAADVLVVGHVGPDPDALGSAVALAAAMRRRGVDAAVAFGDTEPVSPRLRTLDPDGLVLDPGAVPDGPDVLVSCDASGRYRLGLLADRVDTARVSLVIDHHASFTPFGTHQLVDPSAPATVVLVRRVLAELGDPLDAVQASALFAGLYTDTGGLRLGGAPTLALAAELAEAGADPEELLRGLSVARPFDWLAAMGTVLAGAGRDPDAADGDGLVWATVDAATAVRFGGAVGSVVGQLRAVAGDGIAAVVTDRGGGECSVTLRGDGRLDLSAVASRLGGGGHRAAAGAELPGTTDEVVAVLRRELEAQTARMRMPGSRAAVPQS